MIEQETLSKLAKAGLWETTSMNVAAYCRRSTNKQVSSFEVQRNNIDAFCKKHGFKVVKWFEETVSGGARFDNRIQAKAAGEFCEANGYALIVYSFDRLSRSEKFTNEFFKQYEIDAIFVNNPYGHKRGFVTLADYWQGLIMVNDLVEKGGAQ